MDQSEYPPNSEASRNVANKRVEQITSTVGVRKRKSLRKQFAETFFAGDIKSTVKYVTFDVLLLSFREMVLDAINAGSERLMLGDSRRRGIHPPVSGPTGYVSYNRYAMGGASRVGAPQRVMSRMARARHDFDEIILQSRTEAEEVIDRLFDLVGRYGTATVADLYELVGLTASHTDNKWGWSDLRGSGVTRVSTGYLLDLPEPQPF